MWVLTFYVLLLFLGSVVHSDITFGCGLFNEYSLSIKTKKNNTSLRCKLLHPLSFDIFI